MLKAADIANAIVYALAQPKHVSINEILVRPEPPVALEPLASAIQTASVRSSRHRRM